METTTAPKEQTKLKIELGKLFENGLNPRGKIKPESVKELAENISIHGLLNPITVRPSKKGLYEIVAGHRRYNAVKSLDWKDVDCISMELSNEEAFELAVIENLQREDVHPLDEAQAFATILKKSTPEELAKKINKSESYIARRVKLNDLIEPAKKLFYNQDIELAHCIELCRLTSDHQKKCLSFLSAEEVEADWDDNSDDYPSDIKIKHYRPAKVLQAFIKTAIMCELSAAPFKKDDAELYPKAGACINCPKHTGANKNLFNELEKNDMCLDKTCYNIKIDKFIQKKTKDYENDGQEYKLIIDGYGSYGVDQEKYPHVKSLYDYKVVKKETKKSVKGIYVDDSKAGQIVDIELVEGSRMNSYGEPKTPTADLPPDEQIAKIKDRVKRAIEIDRGRVYVQLLKFFDLSYSDDKRSKEFIEWYDSQKIVKDQPALTELEEELFLFAICEGNSQSAGSGFIDDVVFGQELWNKDDANNKIRKVIRGLSESSRRQLSRVYIVDKLFPSNGMLMEKNIYIYNSIVELATHYNPDTTKEILYAQDAIRNKREARADVRIKALQEEIKNKKKPADKKPVAKKKTK